MIGTLAICDILGKEYINVMTNKIKVSDIEIEIKRKNIKNMYLKVSGNDGKVYITAPLKMKDEAIIKFATSKIDWIEKQKRRFERTGIRNLSEYVDDEIHYVWGKPYTLKINYGFKTGVEITDNILRLTVGYDSTLQQRKKLLMEWYRGQLKARLPFYFNKWESIIGVKARAVTIRDMKSRWGSCNTRDKRISINLQLAKKPEICLEYVVVHELVHLLEPSHNAVFKGYMDRFLPDWREIKKYSLNK